MKNHVTVDTYRIIDTVAQAQSLNQVLAANTWTDVGGIDTPINTSVLSWMMDAILEEAV
jgi:hypothetical protein